MTDRCGFPGCGEIEKSPCHVMVQGGFGKNLWNHLFQPPTLDGCDVNVISSRACQRGTKSCVVDHPPTPSQETAQREWDEKAAWLIGPFFEPVSGNGVKCRKAVAAALKDSYRAGMLRAAEIAEREALQAKATNEKVRWRFGLKLADAIKAEAKK